MIKETVTKALLTGAVAGLATNFLFGDSSAVDYFGMSLNPAIASGAGCALGSIGSDLLSNMVIERMSIPQNIKSAEEMAIRLGVCGLATTVALAVGSDIQSSAYPKTFLLGAGSKAGGDWLEEKVIGGNQSIVPLF